MEDQNKTLRILIVDDSPEFIKSLAALIQDVVPSLVETIDKAYTGEDAIELIQKNFYHYVFMDIDMPGINGIEATRFLGYDYYRPEMKIIAVSFHSGDYYEKQMMRAGANDYINKGDIDAEKLIRLFHK
jgi:CheY-like chemotaxis protein